MNYNEYIAYHKQGDAGVEERMIASICRYCRRSKVENFARKYGVKRVFNNTEDEQQRILDYIIKIATEYVGGK